LTGFLEFGEIFFFFNFIKKMCIYNVYEPVWHASLWNKRLYDLCPIFLIQCIYCIRKILGKYPKIIACCWSLRRKQTDYKEMSSGSYSNLSDNFFLFWLLNSQALGSRIFVFFNFINKMCIYNVYEIITYQSDQTVLFGAELRRY
jgi:hypothetical protein